MRSVAFLSALLTATAAYGQDHAHHHAAPAKQQTQDQHSHGQGMAPAIAPEQTPAPVRKGRILHYRDPMGGTDTSPVPKTDSMGMDYIPVYESEVVPALMDHAADRIFDPNVMAAARGLLRREHGGELNSLIIVNILERQSRKGEDGYRWEGEAWYGGDIHRAVMKVKGEGEFEGRVDEVELQALYAGAIGPYFNLQAGLRYDIRPEPSYGYAAVGMEGLVPNWFEVGATLFLSHKADMHARLEGHYDLYVTQRLILQPRAETEIAFQDVPELETGAGISSLEAELRLRYEIRREFAPYIGVTWERKVGQSADFARAAGHGVSATSFVAGVRLFF